MLIRPLRLALLTSLALLAGCGGGGGGGGTPPPPGSKLARITLNVNWPERSRDINAVSSALSIGIVLKGATETGGDFVWKINRGANTAAHTAKHTSTVTAKAGTWEMTTRFYTNADAQGTVVAEATGVVTINEDGSGFPSLSPASRISQVTVPANRNVSVGSPRTIPFTATDGSGNVVALTPGSALWTVTQGQDKLKFVNGQAVGQANGTAVVTATVDGKTSSPVLVTIGPSTGTLTVNVNDPTGSRILKASIKLFQSGFEVKETNISNGSFTFQSLFHGPTEIKVTSAGFAEGQATATVTATPTPVADVTLTAVGLPMATTSATRVISTAGRVTTFETDIVVLDGNGQSVTNLDPTAFRIEPIVVGGAPIIFSLDSASLVDMSPRGPYSALVALDSTQSMRTGDPTNSRLQGIKSFLSGLDGGSNAAFGYFPSLTPGVPLKLFPEIGFVTQGSLYYPKVDEMAVIVTDTGTPTYGAAVSAIEATAVAPNAEKAVVLLADGQINTATTLNMAIDAAKAKGVRVYTVSLGTRTKLDELAELSQKSGGGTAVVTDSQQLTGFYRALSGLLRGTLKAYRVRWTAARDGGDFPANSEFSTTVKVPTSAGLLSALFYVPVN